MKLAPNKPGLKYVSNGILVIQNISKEDTGKEMNKSKCLNSWTLYIFTGNYVCFGENDVGTGHSEEVDIIVLCEYELVYWLSNFLLQTL